MNNIQIPTALCLNSQLKSCSSGQRIHYLLSSILNYYPFLCVHCHGVQLTFGT